MLDIVGEGKTGILVPPRNPQIFAQKTVELLQSGRVPEMKAAARKHFQTTFTQEIFLKKLEEIISDVVDAPKTED